MQIAIGVVAIAMALSRDYHGALLAMLVFSVLEVAARLER